ncbi:MAG: pyridoxamine 5'-phosphate oxidase [Thermodesulfobacteriota bacterium]
MDIGHFRREYLKSGLQAGDLAQDPMVQFTDWFNQAKDTDICDPNAMVLATVGSDGRPSQRTVLLKYYDETGFVFFTNQKSRKAKEIGGNDWVNLHFTWLDLERQISISGKAAPVSTAESARYFMTRPRDSRIAAWVSDQSHHISSRTLLLEKFSEMKEKFGRGEIPLPSFWGGYRVIPHEIEFWQGRKNRLHDRFVYKRHDKQWNINRLAP